ESPGKCTGFAEDLTEGNVLDQRPQRVNGRDLNLRAAPRGEAEAMAFWAIRQVGLKNHIGNRIVRIFINGVRTIEQPRSRKSDVICLQANKSSPHATALPWNMRESIVASRSDVYIPLAPDLDSG